MALRNPTGQPAKFAVDLQQAFELPATAARRYVLRTPWKQSSPGAQYQAEAGQPLEFTLLPWQVLTLEAEPAH